MPVFFSFFKFQSMSLKIRRKKKYYSGGQVHGVFNTIFQLLEACEIGTNTTLMNIIAAHL